jgi:hypothetical protein
MEVIREFIKKALSQVGLVAAQVVLQVKQMDCFRHRLCYRQNKWIAPGTGCATVKTNGLLPAQVVLPSKQMDCFRHKLCCLIEKIFLTIKYNLL